MSSSEQSPIPIATTICINRRRFDAVSLSTTLRITTFDHNVVNVIRSLSVEVIH